MNNIYHIIKDPVHGSMQFTTEEDSWIKPLMNAPHFQRLRHIKQLGMADLIFPGAVHTRFNHCLGCCYIAGQIAKKLDLNKDEKRTVMLAGLLHDIGHGPFSHAFEFLFHEKIIAHEDWTLKFLDDFGEQQLLDKSTLTRIKNLIKGKTADDSLLSDIVSSQLDADRFDYLLRDSHFCGVNYGEYDFRWLLHCLTVIDDGKEKRLGITRKGIGVVEHYLMARRLMVQNVYQNEKKDGVEFLLISFLRALADAVLNQGLFPSLKQNRVIIFLDHLFAFNRQAKTEANRDQLKRDFINQHFDLYKHLYDYDVYQLIRYVAEQSESHTVVKIAKRLQMRQLPVVINLEAHQVDAVQQRVEQFKKENPGVENWQLSLLTLPHLSYEGQDPILVSNRQNKVTSLHDDSLIVKLISDKTEKVHILSIDKEIIECIDLNAMLS